MAVAVTRVQISPAPQEPRVKGEHWDTDVPKGFHNPWPSWNAFGFMEAGKAMRKMTFGMPSKADTAAAVKTIPIVTPTFGASISSNQIKATWLGHACFLVELPATQPGKRGIRVLFDPVFSHRCSPSSFIGPARHTPPPCTVEELPEVDAYVCSHLHYDHLDVPTLEKLVAAQTHHGGKLPVFLPLNTKYCIPKALQSKMEIIELDWWEHREITVSTNDGLIGKANIHCLPAQHTTARTAFDRNHALWASWAVEGVNETPVEGAPPAPGGKVWFGGDSGYCAVHDDAQQRVDPALPVCPAFKDIGSKFGGFDLGLIPIGAYDPRVFMSPMHCNTYDSVRVFKDTQCRKALGMHWGTWMLTTEPIDEPPKQLAEARTELGVSNADFSVCGIGETRGFVVAN